MPCNRAMISTTAPCINPQLLTSALTYIRDAEDDQHNYIKCRALLDTCATANFILETIMKRLNLRVVGQTSTVGTINGMITVSKGTVRITTQSIYNEIRKILTCLTIPTITDLTLSEVFSRDRLRMPSNIKLADPDFHLPRPVDLLIGSGATLALLCDGQVNLSSSGYELYLQRSHLGWIAAGGTSPQPYLKDTCYMIGLENQLAKFWALEDFKENEITKR